METIVLRWSDAGSRMTPKTKGVLFLCVVYPFSFLQLAATPAREEL